MNIPINIKTWVSTDGAGDKTYDEDIIEADCYIEGKIAVIRNKEGEEVISNQQLYIDGTILVDEKDLVVLESGKEYNIEAISAFYDEKGNKDLLVIYL